MKSNNNINSGDAITENKPCINNDATDETVELSSNNTTYLLNSIVMCDRAVVSVT